MAKRAPRERLKAAARKSLLAHQARQRSEAEEIAAGVLSYARDIADEVAPGSLYWQAPLQYVISQMAPRVCAQFELPAARADEVAAYLMAGVNEYVVALVGEFDVEHFERWTAAMAAREGGAGG